MREKDFFSKVYDPSDVYETVFDISAKSSTIATATACTKSSSTTRSVYPDKAQTDADRSDSKSKSVVKGNLPEKDLDSLFDTDDAISAKIMGASLTSLPVIVAASSSLISESNMPATSLSLNSVLRKAYSILPSFLHTQVHDLGGGHSVFRVLMDSLATMTVVINVSGEDVPVDLGFVLPAFFQLNRFKSILQLRAKIGTPKTEFVFST